MDQGPKQLPLIGYDREPGNGVAEADERAPILCPARTDGGRPAGPACDPANTAPGPGDPVQRAHHDHDLQARRPAGSRPASARGTGTGSGGDRADRQHPGQAEIHPGELRRVQAPGQVADQWATDRPGSGPAAQQDDRSAAGGHWPAPGPGRPATVSHTTAPSPACSATRKIPARGPRQPQPPVQRTRQSYASGMPS
jgi:hypothetical protein